MRGITQRAPGGVGSGREVEPDDAEDPRQVLQRHAGGAAALDAADVRGGQADGKGHLGLRQAGGEASLADLAPELGEQQAGEA